MTIFLIISMLAMGFCGYMLIRNHYVYKIRMFAIDRVDFWSKKMFVDVGDDVDKMCRYREFFDILESYPEYNAMMWQLNSFKFEDFYPNFEQRMEQAHSRIVLGVPTFEELQKEFGNE